MAVNGPDIFTHVRVLVGIVIGLGADAALTGLARFMQHRSRSRYI
jgi:hypothetical protein